MMVQNTLSKMKHKERRAEVRNRFTEGQAGENAAAGPEASHITVTYVINEWLFQYLNPEPKRLSIHPGEW